MRNSKGKSPQKNRSTNSGDNLHQKPVGIVTLSVSAILVAWLLKDFVLPHFFAFLRQNPQVMAVPVLQTPAEPASQPEDKAVQPGLAKPRGPQVQRTTDRAEREAEAKADPP